MGAVIGYGNLIDTATITTTGTWSGTYPAINVKKRFLGVFARTTTANAHLRIDLGSAKTIGVIGVAGIVSPATGYIAIMYSSDNFVSDFNYLTSPTHTLLSLYGLGSSFFLPVPNISSRYWAIVPYWDSGTQFDIGRVFLGPKFAPEYGLSFGATMGRESRTDRTESAGGARFHHSRPSRRIITGEFEYLSDDEAHAFRAMQSALDINNEAVLIWDDGDTSTKRVDRNMLCNFDELSDIEFPYATLRKVGIKLSEIIA